MIEENLKKLLAASGIVGSGTILKAIGKIAPRIATFSSGAFGAGYAADQIIDFLRDRLTTKEQKRNLSQLQGRAQAGVARPDERAELVRHEQGRAPFERVAGLAKLGGQAFGGVSSDQAAQAAQLAERQKQEQIFQQQQQQDKLREEEATFRRERDTERDLEKRNLTENRERRSATAEVRAADKHRMAMEKSKQAPRDQAQKASSPAKAAGTPPESYLDALRELDELINRLPR